MNRIHSEDWYEVVGEKQGVDSRDEVKHNEKADQLFAKTMMRVDGTGEHR